MVVQVRAHMVEESDQPLLVMIRKGFLHGVTFALIPQKGFQGAAFLKSCLGSLYHMVVEHPAFFPLYNARTTDGAWH